MSEERPLLLMVCTGNVCRSPMAEGLLAHALAADPELARKFRVGSAGLAAADGEPASRNALEAMRRAGIDLSAHRSRPLTPELAAEARILLGMTGDHLRRIEALFPDQPRQLQLFRSHASEGNPEVPDPFGGNLQEYLETRDALVEAIPGLLQYLRSGAPDRPETV